MELKLKLVAFFKKAWLFLKRYAAELVLGAALVYALLLAKQRAGVVESLLGELKQTREQHRANVDNLNAQVEAEIVRRRSIEATYSRLLTEIQQKNSQTVAEISDLKQKELRELVEKHHDDPEKMAETVSRLFGVPRNGT